MGKTLKFLLLGIVVMSTIPVFSQQDKTDNWKNMELWRDRIKYGMTELQIVGILGDPLYVYRSSENVVLYYQYTPDTFHRVAANKVTVRESVDGTTTVSGPKNLALMWMDMPGVKDLDKRLPSNQDFTRSNIFGHPVSFTGKIFGTVILGITTQEQANRAIEQKENNEKQTDRARTARDETVNSRDPYYRNADRTTDRTPSRATTRTPRTMAGRMQESRERTTENRKEIRDRAIENSPTLRKIGLLSFIEPDWKNLGKRDGKITVVPNKELLYMNPDNWKKLRLDMTEKSVVAVLGQPELIDREVSDDKDTVKLDVFTYGNSLYCGRVVFIWSDKRREYILENYTEPLYPEIIKITNKKSVDEKSQEELLKTIK